MITVPANVLIQVTIQYDVVVQHRVVILLKMSIRTFIDAPASPTKDWSARNKKNTIANMAGVRHRQFWLKG
jgi:hypothetical protein